MDKIKWLDLSNFGLKLYVEGGLKQKSVETGLPNFKIKVININTYKNSLLNTINDLTSINYVQDLNNKDTYIRKSKKTLTAKEFITIFGKENFSNNNVIETTLDKITYNDSDFIKKNNLNNEQVNNILDDEKIKQIIKNKVEKSLPNTKHLGNVERHGEDYGINDIDEEVFIDTFGFKTVEFRWLSSVEENKNLLSFVYHSFMDLSQALNIPVTAISLDGKLKIKLMTSPTSPTASLTHFDSTKNTINLTNLKNAGSLAYGFSHALSFYLTNYLSDKYLEFEILTKNRGLIENLIFNNIENINKNTILNTNLIQQMNNVIKDDKDKMLFNKYVAVIKSLYFKEKTYENFIENNIEHYFYDKKRGLRVLSNTYYSAINTLKNIDLNILKINKPYNKLSNILCNAHSKPIFEYYFEQVVYDKIFPLQEMQKDIEKCFFECKEEIFQNTENNNEMKINNIRASFDNKVDKIVKDKIEKAMQALTVYINDAIIYQINCEDELDINQEEVLDSLNKINKSNFEQTITLNFNEKEFKLNVYSKIEELFLKQINTSPTYSKINVDKLFFEADNLKKEYDALLKKYYNISLDKSKLENNEYQYGLLDLNSYQEGSFIETHYFKSASILDNRKSMNAYYYRKPQEMLARAFESYVLDLLAKNNNRNDYLVSSQKGSINNYNDAIAYPYPSNQNLDHEREKINNHFEEFVDFFKDRVMLINNDIIHMNDMDELSQ